MLFLEDGLKEALDQFAQNPNLTNPLRAHRGGTQQVNLLVKWGGGFIGGWARGWAGG
jgi:hypothetical protein